VKNYYTEGRKCFFEEHWQKPILTDGKGFGSAVGLVSGNGQQPILIDNTVFCC